MEEKKIIFFDGVCNLCNSFIDYVIKRDKEKKIFYCSLQSEEAQTILKPFEIDLEKGLSTIYYYDKGKLYKRSTAILKIYKELSGFPKFASGIALIIPAFLRNVVYDFIAKNRYRFYGKKETCRLPSLEERNQFL
ncbi:DUF393 domain-containing protein [Aquimarina sp. 2201CG5-10]|uniref:thiol-disulfide oxidoreductase DCC family protein n=1 Tax=Aquimarina callyspongiae TaxID=3098150 RepID=UPI002AB5A2BD|nr:DUF393 domain-containing protein [Aquimarina sp. 2201CG5-10]MDY8136292.1 DUF393 domain-containing protein [Aquimarina sp. 2201CG5-10]